jgi:hypothetical protein
MQSPEIKIEKKREQILVHKCQTDASPILFTWYLFRVTKLKF